MILKSLITKIGEGFDKEYYIEVIDTKANGIQIGAGEVLAFSLQQKALNTNLFKEENFDSTEIEVLISIVDCFKNNIGKKHQEMTDLIGLCEGLISELREKDLSDSKSAQPSSSFGVPLAEPLKIDKERQRK